MHERKPPAYPIDSAISVRKGTMVAEGSCVACPPDRRAPLSAEIWVIRIGGKQERLCQRHAARLCGLLLDTYRGR